MLRTDTHSFALWFREQSERSQQQIDPGLTLRSRLNCGPRFLFRQVRGRFREC
jgi:hypothetical protein